jgi:hypothetical protein
VGLDAAPALLHQFAIGIVADRKFRAIDESAAGTDEMFSSMSKPKLTRMKMKMRMMKMSSTRLRTISLQTYIPMILRIFLLVVRRTTDATENWIGDVK